MPRSSARLRSRTPVVAMNATLTLTPVNEGIFAVQDAAGQHVGNLKRIGGAWKFKAVGYTAAGAVVPGGGPLTHQHNAVFEQPDAAALAERFWQP